MTPPKPQYPGNKGFLTVLTDDVVQLSVQPVQFLSGGTGDASNHQAAHTTLAGSITTRISDSEVIA